MASEGVPTFGLAQSAIVTALKSIQEPVQQQRQVDEVDSMTNTFKAYIGQANSKAASMQKEIRTRLDQMNVGDLLGYKDGYFDSSDGLKMAQRAQDNYYKNAVKGFANAALGGLAYANGHIAEGLQQVAAYNEAARGAESMIGRIGDQTRVLQSGDASVADKAVARQGLRKGFGKVEDIYAGMQSVSQLYPALVGTLVSADSFAAQTTANGMMALAQLTGMKGSQRVAGGGVVKDHIRDVLDVIDQQSKSMQSYGEALKADKAGEKSEQLYKDYANSNDIMIRLLDGMGFPTSVERKDVSDNMYGGVK